MVKKLGLYFNRKGKILSEKEYMAAIAPPFRVELIKKYFGRWARMEGAVKSAYPRFADVEPEVEAPAQDPAAAMRAAMDKSSDDE